MTSFRSSIRSVRILTPVAGPADSRLPGIAYGPASFGARYPEDDWYGGFAPRLGGVYSVNEKTVVRAGWGIFYTQAFYPGLGWRNVTGRVLDHADLLGSQGGIAPAFFLDNGFPQNFAQPPDHPLRLQEWPAGTLSPADATSARTRTSGISRWIASWDTISR